MPEAPNSHKTLFFDSCRVVFQGGGARAAALAGAYTEASRAGVYISEVAGTSAGAILAALIGAGASPDFVEKQARGIDFDRLLRPSSHAIVPAPFLHKVIGGFCRLLGQPKASRFLNYGGIYSNEGVQEWLEQLLQELLPNARRPVEFSDLLIPTWVIATDLGARRAKIWSSTDTPDASVADAVTASCAIPILFQPSVSGKTRYVDGGVLSNLPTFVFARQRTGTADPVLAFCLEDGSAEPTSWSARELLKKLVDTIIVGAADLQLRMHPSVSTVHIRTGNLKATDRISPTQIDDLIAGGARATRDFFRSEATRIGTAETATYLRDNDEVYKEVVRQADLQSDLVVVAMPDTRWYFYLFPTVLRLLLEGTKVQALVCPVTGAAREAKGERARRENMRKCGIEVSQVEELPLEGFFFHRSDPNTSACIVLVAKGGHQGIAATRYVGPSHHSVITLAAEKLSYPFDGTAQPSFRPTIRAIDMDEVKRRLKRGVPQYAADVVSLSVEEVDVKDIHPLTQLIRTFKYRQAVRFARDLDSAGIPLFGPCAIELLDGSLSIVGPPVLELHGDRLFGIEGNTRTFFAHRNGISKITCVVATGVKEEPPGRSVSLSTVRLVTGEIPMDRRIPGFEYSRFRKIEGALRRPEDHV